MAHSKDNDLSLDEELVASFVSGDESVPAGEEVAGDQNDGWGDDIGAEEYGTDEPGRLAFDMYETNDQLVVVTRVPGVKKRDNDNPRVSISGDKLVIECAFNDDGDAAKAIRWLTQELYWGDSRCEVDLPSSINKDTVEAELQDGVLTIRFGKVFEDVTSVKIKTKAS
ncbi:Hsp20/alpha crystallin family protein [Candidatus Saccharibacteria bacterium]|nr:Hsp20/alpha crystallin family protein [Candidatus Saccharibacteria bacterium]